MRPDSPVLLDVAAPSTYPTAGTVLVADPAVLEPGPRPPLDELELAAIVDLDTGRPGSRTPSSAGGIARGAAGAITTGAPGKIT